MGIRGVRYLAVWFWSKRTIELNGTDKRKDFKGVKFDLLNLQYNLKIFEISKLAEICEWPTIDST